MVHFLSHFVHVYTVLYPQRSLFCTSNTDPMSRCMSSHDFSLLHNAQVFDHACLYLYSIRSRTRDPSISNNAPVRTF
jgi:hypothetical protein